MAKQRKVNKSQTVRDYVENHPTATNREISEAMAKERIEVTPNHVANIKAKSKSKKTRRGRRRKAAAPAAPTAPAAKQGVGVSELKAAIMLLKACDGLPAAREALAAAHEIRSML